jgi:lantibiotic transport system ATP-binding protein
MSAICTFGLTRRFDGGHGVIDLNLIVPAGGIYAFLGPNGAGKTTTIRLLLGLLRPQAGRIELFGQNIERMHAKALTEVGALVETPSLYPHLSGRDNLEITRRLLNAPRQRIDAVLDRVSLSGDAQRKVGTYSLGMRQRLGLALALLNEPKLLILDEPGNGLDPAGTQDMRDLVRSLSADSGITVFLSSHLLTEVEQVASHIGVLRGGRLCYQGRLDALREQLRGRILLQSATPISALSRLQALGEQARRIDDGRIEIAEPRRDDAQLLQVLVAAGEGISSFHRERPTLETIFFKLTQSKAQPE